MTHETCELFNIIPNEEINRIFNNSQTASAEMDYSFMGFEDVYKSVTMFVPKGKTIIDLGCAYAPQSYYFKDYRGYIGVDTNMPDFHFKTFNSSFYEMSIQDFCKKIVENKWDLEKMFAICSYVPDEEARKIVKETFPYCLVYYPTH